MLIINYDFREILREIRLRFQDDKSELLIRSVHFRETVPRLLMRDRVKMSDIYHANIADFSHLCYAFCL